MKSIFLFSVIAMVAMGCASGNCRSQPQAKTAGATAQTALPTTIEDKIRVYKYDGSLQCGMGKATSLAEMKKELAGITIYSEKAQSDGMMRTQVCGSPTGRANVFEINKSQLSEAKKRGFKEWTFD